MTSWDERERNRGGRGRFTVKASREADVQLNAPVLGFLEENDLRHVQTQFGVAEEQVRRDHTISHALAAISTLGFDDFVFFGGTALSRTHLTGLRLSEDIDLIALGPRTEVANRMQKVLEKQLRRSLGAATLTPALAETRHLDPAVLDVGGHNIQIQLLSSVGYPAWPTEITNIEQRYRDAPPAKMRVLTPAAFVASKLASWHDRAAPRDLYDLWAMAESGMIDREAAAIFIRVGPVSNVDSVPFTNLPTSAQWKAALGHQCIIKATPTQAVTAVREAIRRLH